MDPNDRHLLRRFKNKIPGLCATNHRSTEPLALEIVFPKENTDSVFMEIDDQLHRARGQSPLTRMTGRISIKMPETINESSKRKTGPVDARDHANILAVNSPERSSLDRESNVPTDR